MFLDSHCGDLKRISEKSRSSLLYADFLHGAEHNRCNFCRKKILELSLLLML